MSHANAKCAGCGAHRFEHFGVQEYCHASDYERATNGETFTEEAEPVEQVTTTAGVAGAIVYAQVPESVSAGDAPCAAKLAIATERIAQLEAERAVPGEWICDKCGFALSTRTLNAHSGAVGVRAIVETEPCPNDGTALRSMTWRELAEAQSAGCWNLSERLSAQGDELEALKKETARRSEYVRHRQECKKSPRTVYGVVYGSLLPPHPCTCGLEP